MMKYELTGEMLENVNGGNYGDAKKDNGTEPRYAVGQIVEVFVTSFHHATHTDRIISSYHQHGNLFTRDCWIYTTEKGEHVSADHIES